MTRTTINFSNINAHIRPRLFRTHQGVFPRHALSKTTLSLSIFLCLIGMCLPVFATTKGLNQIVTPDIQPLGILSISPQIQDAAIGNSRQLQLELGITKKFEVAVFQGFRPGQTTLNWEYGLVQHKSFLLSTGMQSIGNGLTSEPFLESGYYKGNASFMVGVQQNSRSECLLGFSYQCTPKIEPMFDYLTGKDNFATAGVTFTLTSNLTLNPAVYVSNSTPHRAYAYAVMTWNTKLW